MLSTIRITLTAAAVAASSLLCLASSASASPSEAAGTTQQVITEPVCRGEYAPVTYDYAWRAASTALPTGAIHFDLWQHGDVTWSQDGITYSGPFTQSISQAYANQDVLRDDLSVEVSGSDGSQVHAWVRIIGQIRDGVPQIDQWNVGINC